MLARTFALAVTLYAVGLSRPALADHEGGARRGPYSIELVDEAGTVLPTFQHHGRSYVLGSLGQRYLLRVHNATARRAEVVASVDGRDVIDGLPAAWEKTGYVVEPYGDVTIDGFRLSQGAVAAFRFSSVPRSYASRMGDARDVGVIGVAVFPERWPEPLPMPLPHRPPGRYPQQPEAGSRSSPNSSGAAGDSKGDAPREREGLARRGLGTEFGEEHGSPVYQVMFERASRRPAAVLSLRYDDGEGLLALGIDVYRRFSSANEDAWTREAASPFRRDGFAEPPAGWGR